MFTTSAPAQAPRRAAAPRFQRCRATWLAPLAVCLALFGCGGGGASDGSANALEIVKVTVVDGFGAPVGGVNVAGPSGSVTTDALGVALIAVTPSGSATTLQLSRESFVGQAVVAAGPPGQVKDVAVTLERATAPAGASLASRSGNLPSIGTAGRELSFEVELVVVDGNARPIDTLSAANFALRACTPDSANGRTDCLRGSSDDADQAYAPTSAAPTLLSRVDGAVARPYAAALLLDQSGSVASSDPTGARLYSAKGFLAGLGDQDQALLAAFAGPPPAPLPGAPLAVYGPFRDRSRAGTYFATLDALQAQVGGGTPLYASIDSMRQQVLVDSSVSALSKAVVVFTDGSDTTCGDAAACNARRAQTVQQANADQVRLFTIGLSSGVDSLALGELATQTGGAFLYADSAEQLLPLYGSLGKLLSLSLPTYRLRWTVQAGSDDAFRAGRTLLGRVQVTQGSSSFDIPVLIGIP